MAAIDTAAREGFDEQAWKLAWTLWTYLDLRGHWHDLARTQTVALAAARRLGNRTAQAYAHRYLARARVQMGDFAAAHRHLGWALLVRPGPEWNAAVAVAATALQDPSN